MYTSPHSEASPVAAHHETRIGQAREEERRLRERSARLAATRLVVALASAAGGFWLLNGEAPAGAGWLPASGLVLFLVLVVVHDRVERRAAWHAAVWSWHQDRVHRARREWDRLTPVAVSDIDPHHPFAHDLDLFGRASLFELLGPPGTAEGRHALTRWLLEVPDERNATARQDAIRELDASPLLRETIAVQGRMVGAASAFDLRVFLEWAEGPHWLHDHPSVLWLARGLGVATPLLLIAQVLGAVGAAWWLLTLAAGLILSWSVRRPMDHTLGRATGWEPAIRAYVDSFRLAEATPFVAPYLKEIQQALHAGSSAAAVGSRPSASRLIHRFQRIVALAEIRHNALVHFPLHALTMWDFHVWAALEAWQRRAGRHVREWLDAIGRLDALVSIATMAADHPDWEIPVVSGSARTFEATAIGHPLLPPTASVRNDVRLGPPGRVLCITGSNMSGKSTLLRAIGINAVLAYAGAPVCARALELPPVALHTSLRVVDSLAEGVSFFMAALGRLKRLVEAAEAARPSGGGQPHIVMYLLDEILQGTNSVERGEAVRIVLRHLLATPAIGAITTHDLGLTETPELRDHGDHVHFRETIHETEEAFDMTFDYHLRPGVATSRNALALLRLVGLGGS